MDMKCVGGGDSAVVAVMEREIMYPPPCSWYQPHVAASRDDMWGYVALSSIVVVKSVGDNKWPVFQLLETNSTKFTAISFCQSQWSEMPVANCALVSGCEQGIVRLWNFETGGVDQFHDAHKGNAIVVQWSPKAASLIYAMDSQGQLSVWDLVKTSVRTLTFGKIGPTCIAVSPFEDDIVAIGSKGGHVQIVDTRGLGTILVKMRHDEEIFSVSWKPKGVWGALNHLQSSTNFEEPFLISSVSSLKPATIRVWDRHGKDVVMLRPVDKDTKDKKMSKNFLPALWVQDSPGSDDEIRLELVSCGRMGEIISWSESATVSDVLHSLHSNYTIFSIIQCGDVLWSLSYEPVIVGWNKKNNFIENIIPTFKGVSSIHTSPVDYTKVAFGGMDAMIRIIGMPPEYPESISSKVPTVTSKLKGKISAVAWHPSKENKLAFGTDEGVIGIYDWKPDNKFAMTFDKRVNGTIYTLDWGPKAQVEEMEVGEHAEIKGKTEDEKHEKIVLYACGGQSVHMIHPDKHNNALVSVSRIIANSNQGSNYSGDVNQKSRNRISEAACDIKWSPDFSYFAIGYNDGRIELYSPPYLKRRCWIKCHGQGIQFMAWRLYDFNPLSNSDSKWFASASNDGTARLFNLSHIFAPEVKGNPEAEVVQVISSVATLKGHGGLRVISLAWSQLSPELIVTVSYDRTAIVWNAVTGDKVARYTNHLHRLVGCIFHPSDPYKVITVSDEMATDFPVHIWDYRHYPYSPYVDHKKSKGSGIVSKAERIETPGFATETEQVNATKDDRRENTDSNSGAKLGVGGLNHDIVYVPVHPSKKEEKSRTVQKRMQRAKALLPVTSNALVNTKRTLESELRYLVDRTPMPVRHGSDESDDDKDSIRSLEDMPNGHSVENMETRKVGFVDPAIHLGILSSADDCARQLKLEREGHLSKDNWDHAIHLSNMLALGSFEDIRGIVNDAIKAGQVTETLIMIAAKHSASVKEEAMKAYVNQLIKEEEYHKAATYLVLLGQIEDAIQLLVGKRNYREAIALAKCALPPELPVVTELQDKWVLQALKEGNFELACKISCSLGNFDQALSIIEKRDFPYAWKAGMYIATKASNLKKVEGFGLKCLEESLDKSDHDKFLELIKEYETLKWMTPIVLVHQILVSISKIEDEKSKEESVENIETIILEKWTNENVLQDKSFFINKIKVLLLLAIPQSSAEAEVIVCKNLTLKLLNDDSTMKTFKEGSLTLCEKWIENKNPSFAKCIKAVVSKIVV